MIKKKNFFFPCLCLIEIIFLMVIGIAGIFGIRNNLKIEMPLDKFESDYIKYSDGWRIDEGAIVVSDKVVLLQISHIELPKGNYTIKMRYECEDDQSFEPYATAYIKSGVAKISKNQTFVSYKINSTEDIDDFGIRVYYNGIGFFEIKDIVIETSTVGIRRQITLLFLFFLLVDICLMFANVIEQNKKLLFTLMGIVALSSIPLLVGGIVQGHDLEFHLMRIEGIAKEFLQGNPHVKLSSLYMDGYGYPVSVYYGDILLYIPAFFRMVGFSVVTSYKTYVFLINIGTTILSYWCFRKIFGDKKISLIVCLVYVTAHYRMMDIYVRAAVGEYSAMMFLPLIAYAIYRIYTEDDSEWKHYRKCALPLSLGMTGLIGTHILSVEMVVVALLLLCVVLWRKTFRKRTVCLYVLAVIQTLVLNLYFIVPFLDYYRNVDVNISTSKNAYGAHIQWKGAYIGDYFSFFKDIFGWNAVNINERMSLTPGIVLMLMLFLAYGLWINGQAGKEIKISVVFAMIFLYMASNLFPWDHVAANYKWGKVLAQVQFPWRYIALATIFMTVLVGWVLIQLSENNTEYQKMVYTGVVIMSIISSFFFISNYNSPITTDRFDNVYYYDTAELNTYSTGPEYMRVGTNTRLFNGEIMSYNMQTVNLILRKGTYMELYCESSNVDGTIEVPMLNYKGYQVTDEYGTEYKIMDGENNVIKFELPAEFSGKIIIDFVQPWYWRLAEWLSMLSALLLSIIFVKNKIALSDGTKQ